MTQAAQPQQPLFGPNAFNRRSAMRAAWISWVTMLVLPFFYFLWVLWTIDRGDGAAPRHFHQGWFIAASLYLIIAVPLSFFGRSRYFRRYWQGKVVPPRDYLVGMLIMWVALEVGGLLALTGSVASGRLLPSLIPALVAFMFFITQFPSGRAMAPHDGQSEDPHLYKEPS